MDVDKLFRRYALLLALSLEPNSAPIRGKTKRNLGMQGFSRAWQRLVPDTFSRDGLAA